MKSKLFVGNIPYEFSEGDLRSIFEEGGRKVDEVKIVTDRLTGKSRGFGFVSFETEEEAREAITTINGSKVGGRVLRVEMAVANGGRKKGYRNSRSRGYRKDSHKRPYRTNRNRFRNTRENSETDES